METVERDVFAVYEFGPSDEPVRYQLETEEQETSWATSNENDSGPREEPIGLRRRRQEARTTPGSPGVSEWEEVRLDPMPLRVLALLVRSWSPKRCTKLRHKKISVEARGAWSSEQPNQFPKENVGKIRKAIGFHCIATWTGAYSFEWEVRRLDGAEAALSPTLRSELEIASATRDGSGGDLVVPADGGPAYFGPATESGAHRPYLPKLRLPAPKDLDVYRLVHWESGLTRDLVGRDDQLDDLMTWALAGESREQPRVRFLVGPGGSGKTRLAFEAMRKLGELGWTGGFVSPGQTWTIPVGDGGIVLVLDYPEERRRETALLLRSVAGISEPKAPLRIVLLSRQAPNDWDTELSEGHARKLLSRQPIETSDLSNHDTTKLFEDAYTSLASHLGREQLTPPTEAFQAWIETDAPLRRLPLFTIAAAVNSVLSGKALLPRTSADVLNALVDREVDRMRLASREAGLDVRSAERFSAVAGLLGDLDASAVRRLARPSAQMNLSRPNAIIHVIDKLPWWQNAHWGAPKPDLVAAVHVWRTLNRDKEKGHPVSGWLWRAIQGSIESRGGSGSSFEIWVRQAERVLYDILKVVGPEAYSRSRGWITEVVGDDPRRARKLEPILTLAPPSDATSQLALKVARLLTEKDSGNSARSAKLLNQTSLQFGLEGKYDEAADATQRAVAIFDSLFAKNPSHYRSQLAEALNNHAIWLDKVGRSEEALAAGSRAVETYRGLAKNDWEGFAARLALALNNWSNRLSREGRGSEAFRAIGEAVEIRRKLCEADRETHEPELARALINFSNQLGDLGQYQEALAPAQESVEIRRRLAKASPWRFDAELGLALNNLSNRLGDLGRLDEGTTVLQEALQIHDRLAAANERRFGADLAHNLNNLSVRLGEAGQRKAALHTNQRAASMYRKLAETLPEEHELNLARALNNLSSRQSETGELRVALGSVREAIKVYRRLVRRNREAHEPELAIALNNLQVRLYDLGVHADAVIAGIEAAAIQRRLAATSPKRFEYCLAQTLNNLSLTHFADNDPTRALAAAEEAVTIRRRLNAAAGGRYDSEVAQSLNNWQLRLMGCDEVDKALAVGREAVALRRELAKRSAGRFEPGLARSLGNLSVTLEASGQVQEALEAASEATEIYRRYHSAEPRAWARRFALTLSVLSRHQIRAKLFGEAATTLSEAAPLARALANEEPKAHGPNLVTVLERHLEVLEHSGEATKAKMTRAELQKWRKRISTSSKVAAQVGPKP